MWRWQAEVGGEGGALQKLTGLAPGLMPPCPIPLFPHFTRRTHSSPPASPPAAPHPLSNPPTCPCPPKDVPAHLPRLALLPAPL